jgi:hypothetical protein
MAKPSTQPRWIATGEISTPTTGAQNTGHVPNTPLAAQLVNWFWNLVYQWVAYFDLQMDTNTAAIATNAASIATNTTAIATEKSRMDAIATNYGSSILDPTNASQVSDLIQSKNEIQAIINPIKVTAGANQWKAFASNEAGTIIAVGVGATIASSTDGGRSWTSRTADTTGGGGTGDYQAALWVQGITKFVIAGTHDIQTSPDGITWTCTSVYTNLVSPALALKGTQILAVGNNSGTCAVLTSTTGASWAATIVATTFNTRAAAASNGTTYVVPDDGLSTTIYLSTNGTTWTTTALPSACGVESLEWFAAGGFFVAYGSTSTGRALFTSPTGTTWTLMQSDTNGTGPLIVTKTAAYALSRAVTWTVLKNNTCPTSLFLQTPVVTTVIGRGKFLHWNYRSYLALSYGGSTEIQRSQTWLDGF